MLYGEHISAEEVPTKCACGATVSVEVFDKYERSHGLHCRGCGQRKLRDLLRQEKIARAIVRKVRT